MASIRKEIVIDASAERVWDALSDWGGLHVRLVPGFATDARLDGEDRIVTFFNGSVLRERCQRRRSACFPKTAAYRRLFAAPHGRKRSR